MSNERNYKILEYSKHMIDKTIHLFLFNLIKDIFLRKRKLARTSKVDKKMEDFIKKINEIIINKKRKELKKKNTFQEKDIEKKIKEIIITLDYSEKNLINIFNFIKFQNRVYASEIIENILIFVFSFAFKNEKENIFEKFLYNNMNRIKTPKDLDLSTWFNPNEFKENIESLSKANKLKQLLENDVSTHQYSKASNKIEEEPILSLLKIKEESKKEKDVTYYRKFFNYLFLSLDYDDFILNKNIDNNDSSKTFTTEKSISVVSLASNYYIEGPFISVPMRLLRSLLISVYILSQNKFSPLMEYAKESKDKKDLVNTPFSYNLS